MEILKGNDMKDVLSVVFRPMVKIGLVVIGLQIVGCSVQPTSVVIPASEETPKVSAPVKSVYEPSGRSNTAYPSSAAKGLMVKAEGYFQAGDAASAMGYLERAQRISPRAPEIYLEMAEVRHHLGQTNQAKQLARKALSLVGDDELLKSKADNLLSELGN